MTNGERLALALVAFLAAGALWVLAAIPMAVLRVSPEVWLFTGAPFLAAAPLLGWRYADRIEAWLDERK